MPKQEAELELLTKTRLLAHTRYKWRVPLTDIFPPSKDVLVVFEETQRHMPADRRLYLGTSEKKRKCHFVIRGLEADSLPSCTQASETINDFRSEARPDSELSQASLESRLL